MPSSTPDGMFTASDFSFCTRPAPRHSGQGSGDDLAGALAGGQVRSTVKKPCCARTLPAPPQVPHAVGRVPARAPEPLQGSQPTVPGTRIVACLPENASSSEISML